ncbi:GNAT family N-acetyltransferase [Streptomyces sp. NBC_01218]|uniref:GNAT family N-acetyltransferase n=1 Tax=Streptomyces sp. NBC_01218 TaxID=2903780 RepID=UPI002E0F0769|nr:GNAT family N-acetyltransferase [Streptomyces sp. NBC_01218]
MRIRSARRSDLRRLQDIERAAGEPFRALGMADVADDEPPSLALLESYRAAGRCWVAAHPHAREDDRPVGYLLADPVDGAAHIEQVSVDPSAARLGIGRALIDHVAAWAEEQGLAALTLTTFADVPWNAPYYARIGFTVLREEELTDGLRRIRAEEVDSGLHLRPRVCMRRAPARIVLPRPVAPTAVARPAGRGQRADVVSGER